jgi:hypothetical protein
MTYGFATCCRRLRQIALEDTVNRLVAGSNPARGAKFNQTLVVMASSAKFVPGTPGVLTPKHQVSSPKAGPRALSESERSGMIF